MTSKVTGTHVSLFILVSGNWNFFISVRISLTNSLSWNQIWIKFLLFYYNSIFKFTGRRGAGGHLWQVEKSQEGADEPGGHAGSVQAYISYHT